MTRTSAAGDSAVHLTPVSLTIGIVGLPNVGKSHPLQRADQERRARGELPVRDDRAERRRGRRCPTRGSTSSPRSSTRPEDRAGDRCRSSTSPASCAARREGEGLGNKFLANIREADAICQVVRAFADPNVVHVDGEVVAEGRHRDDQHRADPRRPADPREGAAAAREGGRGSTRTRAAGRRPRRRRRRSCSTAGTTLFAGARRPASTWRRCASCTC